MSVHITAIAYEIYTLYKFHKTSFGQERTNEIGISPQWNKVRTHYGIRLELWLLQGHNETKRDWNKVRTHYGIRLELWLLQGHNKTKPDLNKVRTHCGIRLWNAWILWCIFIFKQLLCTEWFDSDFESDHLCVTSCQAQFYSIIKWVSRIIYIITLCCN